LPQGLDPKVDVVFKSIFGTEENKSILISLLNAVLGWTGEQQIVAAKILNPYLEPEYIDDSYGILDIKVQLGTGELVDVEMQMGDRANMERRSTYYICRIFGDQKITRSRYQDLNRAIAINKQWRDTNPDKSGNIRDYATLNQLLVLANIESYNAILIEQGRPQSERLQLLNKLAIRQLKAIREIDVDAIKKFEGKK